MKLTEKAVRAVAANGKVQKHADGGGLFLYVTPKGRKSWRLAYRYLGRQKLLVIGPWPEFSLLEARQRREAAKKMLLAHIDPSAAKRAAKDEALAAARNTLAAVTQDWLDKFAGHWAPRTANAIAGDLTQTLLPALGARPIKSITPPELLHLLRGVECRSVVKAHRLLSECGRIFRYAVATGRAERDVAADLRGALRPLRSRHLAALTNPGEIGRLLRALDGYWSSFPVQCALRMAPYVFVRANELSGARWREFDLHRGEWRIPAERMKNRVAHIVPLARQVVEILEQLRGHNGDGLFLFPGRRSSQNGITPLTLVKALRRLGYDKEQMSFHGFRSLASTLLNEQGYNRDLIERQLAHCEKNRVRASYNHAQYLPERKKMMQEWANYLDRLRNAHQEGQPAGSRDKPDGAWRAGPAGHADATAPDDARASSPCDDLSTEN